MVFFLSDRGGHDSVDNVSDWRFAGGGNSSVSDEGDSRRSTFSREDASRLVVDLDEVDAFRLGSSPECAAATAAGSQVDVVPSSAAWATLGDR